VLAVGKDGNKIIKQVSPLVNNEVPACLFVFSVFWFSSPSQNDLCVLA